MVGHCSRFWKLGSTFVCANYACPSSESGPTSATLMAYERSFSRLCQQSRANYSSHPSSASFLQAPSKACPAQVNASSRHEYNLVASSAIAVSARHMECTGSACISQQRSLHSAKLTPVSNRNRTVKVSAAYQNSNGPASEYRPTSRATRIATAPEPQFNTSSAAGVSAVA